jgi:signal transduction histidine kinase
MIGSVSDVVARYKDASVARWVEKLRSLHGEDALTTRQLTNSVHVFMTEIIESLRQHQVPPPGDDSVAREHGRQRHELGVGLASLVQEYGLLLDAIVDAASAGGEPLDATAVRRLAHCLTTAASAAAHEHAERDAARRQHDDGERFAFIAHELRGPLSTVRLALDDAGDRLERGMRDLLARNLDRVAALIDDTIAHAKLDMIGKDLRGEPLAVVDLVEGVAGDVAAMAASRSMRIARRVDQSLVVHGDHRLLYSVLANLTRNAIKFSHHGASIGIAAAREEGRVLIEVADECGGLDGAEIERVFRAFQQTRGDRSGFGLGLALSKAAVEAHGGSLNIYNVEGVGCRFVVDLPAAPAS